MDAVAALYDADPEREWQRLEKDAYRRLQFQVTMRLLTEHLPPDGTVLDAGGGPGRYAFALCQAGYRVVLLDLSPGNVALAKEKLASRPPAVQERLLDAVAGDVRDLSRFDDAAFDGVVCLDPLTYLPEEDDRDLAVAGLVRVTRPGGVVCIGVRGYLALYRTMLARSGDELVDPWVDEFAATGAAPVQGLPCRFYRAEEIRRLAEAHGLDTIAMAGAPGLSSGLAEATNRLAEDEAGWGKWTEITLRTAGEPAVVDTSEYILYVGRTGGGQ